MLTLTLIATATLDIGKPTDVEIYHLGGTYEPDPLRLFGLGDDDPSRVGNKPCDYAVYVRTSSDWPDCHLADRLSDDCKTTIPYAVPRPDLRDYTVGHLVTTYCSCNIASAIDRAAEYLAAELARDAKRGAVVTRIEDNGVVDFSAAP